MTKKKQITPEELTTLGVSAAVALGGVLLVEAIRQIKEQSNDDGYFNKPLWWILAGWPLNQLMDPNIKEKVEREMGERAKKTQEAAERVKDYVTDELQEQRKRTSRSIGETVAPFANLLGWNRKGGIL